MRHPLGLRLGVGALRPAGVVRAGGRAGGAARRRARRLRRLVAAKAKATRWPPFHYLISNAATAWATADPEITAAYTGLMRDRATADRILAEIMAGHARTGAMLTEIYGTPLSEARADVQTSLTRRAEALAPLHRHQITLPADWRAHRAAGDAAAAETRLAAFLPTLNAIAAGIGATG